MKIELENINTVKSAAIQLNGLTVIAGENGSGKSTVGKMLFSVIQVLKSTQEHSLQKRNNLIEKYIKTLYTRLRSIQGPLTNEHLRHLFVPTLAKQLIEGEITVQQLQESVNVFLSEFDVVTPRTRANVDHDFHSLKLAVENADNRSAVNFGYIQSIIESEFLNSVCSIGTESSSVHFTISETENAYLFFTLVNNEVKHVSGIGQEYLEDATYVESPLYLHMIDTLAFSMQYLELDNRPMMRGMIPTHIKDFVSKMMYARNISYSPNLFDDNLVFLEEIQNVLSGSFQYDKETGRLLFVQNGRSFSPINTASGNKAFGVLQLLLQSESISPNRILIWDEPENHLHPHWQIQFANVLVQLTQAGIPIVISTHSPYFLQAIRYYAAKYEAERSVNYYFAETTTDGLSIINEATDDLNRVFVKLAEPLHNVMNIPNSNSVNQ